MLWRLATFSMTTEGSTHTQARQAAITDPMLDSVGNSGSGDNEIITYSIDAKAANHHGSGFLLP